MRALNESASETEGRRTDRPRKRISKKVEKLLKNLLTKEKRCDIIIGSLCGSPAEAKSLKEITKIFEKLFKNLLTNGKRCDIIVGHFARGAKGMVQKEP